HQIVSKQDDPPCDRDTEGRWDWNPWDSWDPSGPSDFSRSLPAEMSEQIFLQLDPQSLCCAAQTCRRWHRLIHSSDAVWRGQCLLLRAHCQRELEQDRVTLVRNYTRSRLKRDWLRGRFSCVRSANELRDVRMVPLDAESWGEILQAELER
uniref:F-box protein 48 n=1 Tax=Neogobius melanostomus TaxID=47308 RepID=A0A8C6T6U3_9GOBI